ncbi:MAG: hypothetical protein ABIF82_15190 [Planctomycetota bacterium]
MRPVFWYILIVAAVAIIAMFFVSQHSKHMQIGYELTRLWQERETLRELGRKLDFDIDRAAGREALAGAARRLGLALEPPTPSGGPD